MIELVQFELDRETVICRDEDDAQEWTVVFEAEIFGEVSY